MKTVEIRVRPVTRYIVTRFESEETGYGTNAASVTIGEYENMALANKVAKALQLSEPCAVYIQGAHPPGLQDAASQIVAQHQRENEAMRRVIEKQANEHDDCSTKPAQGFRY